MLRLNTTWIPGRFSTLYRILSDTKKQNVRKNMDYSTVSNRNIFCVLIAGTERRYNVFKFSMALKILL